MSDMDERLLTKFIVNKVEYEPHAESTWWLEYQGKGPIKCYEQLFETLESDEELVGKEIEAQIDLSSCEVLPTVKKERAMHFEGNVITATGIYEDDLVYKVKDEYETEYLLDSVFPMRVTLLKDPIPVKKGDWITVSGEAFLILPRGCNLK